jgi:hypothetical protein
MSDDPEMDARYGFARRPPPWKPDEDEWLSLFLDDGENLADPDVLERIIRQLSD